MKNKLTKGRHFNMKFVDEKNNYTKKKCTSGSISCLGTYCFLNLEL